MISLSIGSFTDRYHVVFLQTFFGEKTFETEPTYLTISQKGCIVSGRRPKPVEKFFECTESAERNLLIPWPPQTYMFRGFYGK